MAQDRTWYEPQVEESEDRVWFEQPVDVEPPPDVSLSEAFGPEGPEERRALYEQQKEYAVTRPTDVPERKRALTEATLKSVLGPERYEPSERFGEGAKDFLHSADIARSFSFDSAKQKFIDKWRPKYKKYFNYKPVAKPGSKFVDGTSAF